MDELNPSEETLRSPMDTIMDLLVSLPAGRLSVSQKLICFLLEYN